MVLKLFSNPFLLKAFGNGARSQLIYSGFQMSVYSFENKKSVPLRVLSFHFAYGKMKTAIVTKATSWLRSVTLSHF